MPRLRPYEIVVLRLKGVVRLRYSRFVQGLTAIIQLLQAVVEHRIVDKLRSYLKVLHIKCVLRVPDALAPIQVFHRQF